MIKTAVASMDEVFDTHTVYDAPDLLEPLGNLLKEPVSEIWARYRFKRNHFAKYLGASIRTVSNVGTAAKGGGHARA
ncbi:hypothetical protein [Solwaraspora sp. WMMA2065]|uniref:hypothetical protein n=1 Tax=Solwaraspora sp. WMMA2065 TaxID=3015166 RepID=UPI00259BD51F|nr:hypothetical protein [Solwaraspora sp. WMMA2065]WJK33731.1 hypothetical protein O7610_24110 [Solwaraspora sp. WMMA2065]